MKRTAYGTGFVYEVLSKKQARTLPGGEVFWGEGEYVVYNHSSRKIISVGSAEECTKTVNVLVYPGWSGLRPTGKDARMYA